MRRNGFTLVEMLVALVVFALLAAAGVGVLRSSIDVQSSVDTRLTAIGGIARLNALLSSDLSQAVDRPSRASSAERPSFVGDAGGMEFVSAGRADLDGAARSDLQRVEWRFRDGILQRTGFAAIDGPDEGLSSPIANDIRSVSFRYRMRDGSWNPAFTPTTQQPLPAAVEMSMTPSSGATVVMVFAVPPGAVPPPSFDQTLAGGSTPEQLLPTGQGA